MELEVVDSIENIEELQELYQTYPWWEDREIENLKQAVKQTDVIIGIRDLQDDSLVASARVLTDYVYYGKIFDVIVDEAFRGKGGRTASYERYHRTP